MVFHQKYLHPSFSRAALESTREAAVGCCSDRASAVLSCSPIPSKSRRSGGGGVPLTRAVWTEPRALRATTAAACVCQCCCCWRAQQSCSSSRASPELSQEGPAMVKVTKSKTFQAYLPNCHRTYSCVHCRAHLANHDELISKSFQGSQGRAYLFNSVVNVGCGPAEERVLLTGLHAVADIYCENCKTTLGWKYEHAFESSQKYKEGKFIIELAHMVKDNGWE
ncbi:protein yippee-like 1 isoform X2 [Ovis canadensis]|uniref:protein yippee-like 1 isoform X2 n=1 Tax=Ovis canadensis TaxID=37174 RepID=UPI003750A6AE